MAGKENEMAEMRTIMNIEDRAEAQALSDILKDTPIGVKGREEILLAGVGMGFNWKSERDFRQGHEAGFKEGYEIGFKDGADPGNRQETAAER